MEGSGDRDEEPIADGANLVLLVAHHVPQVASLIPGIASPTALVAHQVPLVPGLVPRLTNVVPLVTRPVPL